jgi:hypothetical protein
VLIVTKFDVDEYVYSALRAGASGFLLSAMTGKYELVRTARETAMDVARLMFFDFKAAPSVVGAPPARSSPNV